MQKLFLGDFIMTLRIKQNFVRIVTCISVFFFSAYITPSFNVETLPALIIASLFVVILDYLVSTITNIHDYPLGRGIIGFLSSIVIVYSPQFFIAGFYISFISSIIVALIYSVCDYCLPNR